MKRVSYSSQCKVSILCSIRRIVVHEVSNEINSIANIIKRVSVGPDLVPAPAFINKSISANQETAEIYQCKKKQCLGQNT